jgi:CxxC-x17-CxxC domain-containing protein
MSFTDKSLTCSDCGTSFIFTVGEQEFYATKGLTNEPKRCSSCRQANRSKRGDAGNHTSTREMFPATCAECGKDTKVPFEPRGDKPVYCSDCYSKVRVSR